MTPRPIGQTRSRRRFRYEPLPDIELPLAAPSIRNGLNQSVMMSLSMVVIASLIGAEGLGALILEALQYAAKGPGLLGGFAILFVAMVLDRIVQGDLFVRRSPAAARQQQQQPGGQAYSLSFSQLAGCHFLSHNRLRRLGLLQR